MFTRTMKHLLNFLVNRWKLGQEHLTKSIITALLYRKAQRFFVLVTLSVKKISYFVLSKTVNLVKIVWIYNSD